jgi:predicted Fe-S protein YdhL (DUF1289 family)
MSMETKYTFDENTVSDLHKDAHGWRPREYFWAEWHAASNDGKQAIWEDLIDDLKDSNEREERQQKDAIAATEKRIQEILDTVVGSTRADAIRYLDEAYDTRGDINFLEYHLGVPYGYLTGRVMGMLVGPVLV